MIDIRLLRTDPNGVRDAIARRHTPELLEQLDRAAALDATLRDLSSDRDELRRRVNDLSKQVGRLRKAGDTDGAEAVMQESRALGDRERVLAEQTTTVEEDLRQILLRIPNLPHPDAPDGAGEDDNPVVTGPVGMPPDGFAPHQLVPHWETGAALGILDNERATKISGAMFTMTRGLGATMGRALCQLALDRNADAFEEIRPPSLVTTATLTATGQLPKFSDDAYAIERDDLWCIPTAEVPLTSLAAGEILDEATLPARMMAYTPCYRREAGSAGRDTRGLLRTHEFDKVEILAYATAEQAVTLLPEMIGRAEALLVALELPYRIIEICTGDMGQSHHRSFDLEVYAPGSGKWLEVSSVSWFGDYQARRADLRYRPAGEKGTRMVHTLNGSALAVPRVWAAIVENHRQADGSVAIPAALHPYIRRDGHLPLSRRTTGVGLADRRIEYETAGLDVADVAGDPIEQWWAWYRQAEEAGLVEPQAMTVATVDAQGSPDARLVLVRGVDASGFTFFTNYASAKSSQLGTAPRAALVFAWLELHRQVRVRGSVERVSDAESDAYFAGRPRGSQIGAWASPQSEVLSGRGDLDALVAAVEARFAGEDVPRPPQWGGWRVRPDVVEFWQGRPSRLHDRVRYRREDPGSSVTGASAADATGWRIERLAP